MLNCSFQRANRKYLRIRLIKITPRIEFGGGCVEYEVEDLFTGKLFTHTEFPPHWNVERIAQEIKNLYEKAIHQKLFDPRMVKPIDMMTNDGFDLKIVTNPAPLMHECIAIEGTLNNHIVTARPIYKG